MTARHTSRSLVAAAWIALLCVSWSGPAHAGGASDVPDQVARIAARLDPSPVIRGNFTQHKRVQGFRNPLVSTGVFVTARGQGVLWTTQTPFASEMVVTAERLRIRAPNGGVQELDGKREPALKAINRLLLGLLGGDVEALQAQFQTTAVSLQGDRWSIALTPRDPGLARFVAEVSVRGDRHLEEVRLVEASGDETLIRFSHHRADRQVTDVERERFSR